MKKHHWIIFLVLGLLILLFAAYNEYIKYYFRIQGMWQFAYGLLVIATAAGGLRQHQRWAWIGSWSVPLVPALMAFMAPWTLPVLIVPILVAISTLLLSRPIVFNDK